MPLFEVDFYEKASGKQPAKEFLLGLDKKMRAKMLRMIAILAENGTELREPYSKHRNDHPYKWIYQENPEDTF